MSRLVLLAVLVVTLRTAHADTDRYGLEIAASDGAAYATLAIGVGADSEPLLYLGMAGVILGAPTVHLLEGNAPGAAGSLVLRVGLPVVGGFVGGSGGHGLESIGRTLVGIVAGSLAASVIDIAWLAKHDDPTAAPTARMITFGGSF
ncbi:MAG TPA: hypothetical protein VFQ53_04975 [Kofleriaceae bacterium]|nr:hypothetical protein [Kofleriaceae bacterium]